jgi:hypothetical protein
MPIPTPPTSTSIYPVYKICHKIAIPDPDMRQPRFHTVLFVLISSSPSLDPNIPGPTPSASVPFSPSGSGFIHHVTGDLVTGMRYETRPETNPQELETFHDAELLGTVDADTYPGNVDAVCRACEPPGRQKGFNVWTGRTEPLKEGGVFYEPGEEKKRLVKCTEWVEEGVIPALTRAGVLMRV